MARYFPPGEADVFHATKWLFNMKMIKENLARLPTMEKDAYVLFRMLTGYARKVEPVLGLTGIQRAVEAKLGGVEQQLRLREKQLVADGTLAGIPSSGCLEPPQSASTSRPACGACAYICRECVPYCPLAPFFPTVNCNTHVLNLV
jgi:hypothetical protein